MIGEERFEILIDRAVERLVSVLSRSAPGTPDGEGEGPPEGRRTASLRHFRRRFDLLNLGLTGRELDVCARVMVGMSTEAIALDLDLGKATVATYRRRAYARLGVTSPYEMFRLLL